MGSVSTPLSEEARSIFAELGYSISERGAEFDAVRDWKEVVVTPVEGGVETPDDDGLHCYVTWKEEVGDLQQSLALSDPAGEWALIGVDEDGTYEVARAPAPASR